MKDFTDNKVPLVESEKILVAYFSRSGNTRSIALQIQGFTGGDLFEIKRVKQYPGNYNALLKEAKSEIQNNEKPRITDNVKDFGKYDVLFIGYPNWWNTFPAPVLSFLSEYDFSGKTIIPFCTHGGGGGGRSFTDIAKQCPKANILDSFSINGYSVTKSNKEVINWIEKIKLLLNNNKEI